MTALEKALKLSPTAAAKALQRHGRGKDSILAHINPREAELLKALGGSGKRNPKTGLLEFQDEYSDTYASTSEPSPIFGGGSGDSGGGGGGFLSGLFGGGGSDTSGTAPVTPVTSQDLGGSTDAPFSGGAPSGGGFDPSLYPDIFGAQAGSAQQPTAAAPPTAAAAPAAATRAAAVQNDPFGSAALGRTPVAGSPGPSSLQLGSPDTALGGGGTGGTSTGASQDKSFGDKLLSGLGDLASPGNLTKLLAAGIPAGIGLLSANKQKGLAQQAQQQGTQQAQQISAIGTPYTNIGSQQIQAATQGALTPMSAQAYQNAQAVAAQDAAKRGGVGAQQGAMQVEALRQKLLNNQLNVGLAVQSVGDQYTMQGIKAQMASDTQINQASTAYYQQLFNVLGSSVKPVGSTIAGAISQPFTGAANAPA